MAQFGAGRRAVSETRISTAAAAALHRTHSPSWNVGRGAQISRVPKPMPGQYGRYVRIAIQRPTPTPIGTDATRRAFVTMGLIQQMLARPRVQRGVP